MKNLLLVIIVFLSLVSCGKKGDPTFKEEKQNSKIFNSQLNIVT